MPGRQVIYISNHKIAAYFVDGGCVQFRYFFDHDLIEEQLPAIIKKTRHVPCVIIVDVIEEDYKKETIPHSLPHEREKLIKRKLRQLFRETPFRLGKVIGREKTGRRDDMLMASAIINPDLIKPCLSILNKHHVPLIGIYSVPLLSVDMVKKLKLAHDNLLLISQQEPSGIRQSYFRNNRLQLSRLTTLTDWKKNDLPQWLEKEIEKTLGYINRLRLMPQDAALNIMFLGSPTQAALMSSYFEGDDHIKFKYLHTEEFTAKLRLPKIKKSFAEDAFVHYVLKNKPKNHYATTDQRFYNHHRLAAITVKSAGAVISAGLLFFSGSFLMDALSYRQQNHTVRLQTDTVYARIQQIKSAIPASELPAVQTKAAVEMGEYLRRLPYQPAGLLEKFAVLLDQQPELRVDDIHWLADSDPDSGLNSKEKMIPGLSAEKLKQQDELTGTGQPYQIVILRGEVHPFNGDYRKALNAVNTFMDRVRQIPGVKKTVATELPIDLASDASVVEDTSGHKTLAKAAFSLRIIFRKDHEATES